MSKISLFEPNISALEKKFVLKSLSKNQISSYGVFNNLFEKEIKKITGSEYNLPTNNGSSALFLALKSAGIKSDEIVITQSYTFAATTNAIILNKSIPLLIDISKENLNLDVEKLKFFFDNHTYQKKNHTYHKKTNKKITCICCVVTLGLVPDLHKIIFFKKKYNLKIVLDAACALGSKYFNKPLSKFSDIVIYSLNGNKNFTAGSGGVLSTENKNYYIFSKTFLNNGKKHNGYSYKMIGFNLNMSSLNAALALAQIKRFKEIKKNILQIRNWYKKYLYPINLFNSNFTWGNYFPWMNFFLTKNKKEKISLVAKLKKKKILVNYFWYPMHKQPIKKNFLLTSFNNTNFIYDRIVVLPSSTFLSHRQIKNISKIIKKTYV